MAADTLVLEQDNALHQSSLQAFDQRITDWFVKSVDAVGDLIIDGFNNAMNKIAGAVGEKIGSLSGLAPTGASSDFGSGGVFLQGLNGNGSALGHAIELQPQISPSIAQAVAGAGIGMREFQMADVPLSSLTGYDSISPVSTTPDMNIGVQPSLAATPSRH